MKTLFILSIVGICLLLGNIFNENKINEKETELIFSNIYMKNNKFILERYKFSSF